MMDRIMSCEKMDSLIELDLYHVKAGYDLNGELWNMAIPNYTYCRITAPVYEHNGTEWVLTRGELEVNENDIGDDPPYPTPG